MFIDNDNAGDKWARRPRMIHMNMSLINWYSKKQSTVEKSVFGAAFIAMKVSVETFHAIQYYFMT